MNQDEQKQLQQHLDELRDRATEHLGDDPARLQPVTAHIEQVRGLVARGPSQQGDAHVAARGLEERLLAWEAEHPQLTQLASRIARALENAGL